MVRRAFALALRNLRQQAGISQENLAYATGVERSHVSGLERGKSSPTIEMVYRLIPELNVSFPQFAAEMDKCMRRVRRAGPPKDE
jgi:transcriptional regulator with XRE-family HTH domain